jgi:DNA-binding response OmpR family regulator
MMGDNTGIAKESLRLLIVEDDVSIAVALREGLEIQGFQPAVVHSAGAAHIAVRQSPFDLFLFDVSLPEGAEAGLDLAQEFREADFRQPILFVTAGEALSERVRGLEHGDDYLPKPFELWEIGACLKALARRGDTRPRVVQWNGVTLETDIRTVSREDQRVRLTQKEYELLELFMLNAGRTFTHAEVLEQVWGKGFGSTESLVETYIKNLRAKLGENLLETVREVGYRFSG